SAALDDQIVRGLLRDERRRAQQRQQKLGNPHHDRIAESLLVAVGNCPTLAPITSSPIVRYRSPIVPVTCECIPVASLPAWPARIAPCPIFLWGLASACSCT